MRGVSEPPLRVGISACLLGENVRFDGGHKRDAFLVETLGRFVEWVPVCPEVELGLGTPRETLRDGDDARLVSRSGIDHTEPMRRFAARRLEDLAGLDLSGFVLKSKSPTCGMERVKVYGGKGAPAKDGRGIFARALCARYPLLPVEEEGRLCAPRLRENFIERLFAYRRLRAFFQGRWTLGSLVAFHTAHKLLLLAHSPAAYQRLGRLVAGAKRIPRNELRQRYESELMEALRIQATAGRNANVLSHAAGYVSKGLDAADREELRQIIDDYRRGLVPLVVPITLLRHHVRRLDVGYLKDQVYLDPHPRELMLRNHV